MVENVGQSQSQPQSNISFGRRLSWFGGVGVLVCLIVITVWTRWPVVHRQTERETGSGAKWSSERQVLPEGDYVGSESCRECHDTIYDAYFHTHGMGNSAAPVLRATIIEDFQHARFQTPDGRQYEVVRQDDKCVHRESFEDTSGEVLFEESVAVEYAIGSGVRGRGYLFCRDGRMYQSPISWYSQRHTWDLSPGYLPGQHQRFLRRINQDCLFCHVGRLAWNEQQQVFDEPVIVEAAIGCERCHGPAGEHVRRRQAGDIDNSLVQLAELPPERRDAICWQCHLRAVLWVSHPGKSRFSFRPGDLLEDHVLIVPEGSDTGIGQQPASVVLQLASSRCYVESGGKLGCISCHDPHRRPTPENRAAYYQQKCLQCHQEDSCTLDVALRVAPPAEGRCVECHMPRLPTPAVPHTALTDHRIVRRPGMDPGKKAADGKPRSFFRQDHWQLPEALVQRAGGIAWAERATAGDVTAATEAIRLLEPLRATFPSDTTLLLYLGSAYAVSRRLDLAHATWTSLIELDRHNEDALRFLALVRYSRGDSQGALDALEQWRAVNPDPPELYFIASKAWHSLGNIDEAIRAAQEAVYRDPTALASHYWLAELLDSQHRAEEAAQQRAWIERYVTALRAKLPQSPPAAPK